MIQARRVRLSLTLAAAALAVLSTGRDAAFAGADAAPRMPNAPQDPAPQEPPEEPAPQGPAPADDPPPAPKPANEEPVDVKPDASEAEAAARRKLEEAVKRALELGRAADGPSDEQDAAAREYLERAATRQGGIGLVAPDGALESFQVTLQRVVFEQEKIGDDGSVTNVQMEADEKGLVLSWKGEQIRTQWSIDGKKTQRGRFARNGALVPWLHDGTKIQPLAGDDRYAKDREQIDRDQRIVRALLDVGILRTMLADGSRWQIIDDASYPGIALRRTPPAAKDVQLQLTLWVDKASAQVNAARLSPNAEDEATMLYVFKYDRDFPKVTGAKLVFPFEFQVLEQMPVAQLREKDLVASPPAPKKIMDGAVAEVAFNGLTDADLAPPRAQK